MLSPAIAATLGPMRAPFLLLVPVVVGLGWAAALYDGVSVAGSDLAMAALGALAAHISVNALNEYEDFRSGLDLLTRPTPFSGGTGTLPAHPDKAHYALGVALASLALVVAVGLYFVSVQGAGLLPLGVVGVGLIVLYTRFLTRSPILCLFAPGVAFGPLMVMGVYFALAGRYGLTPALASLVPLFLVSNLLLMNQFPDREADRQVGRRHLLLAHGPAAGIRVYGLFLLCAYAAVVAAVLSQGLPPATLLSLLSVPLGWLAFSGLRRHYSEVPALIPHMAQNVALNLVTPLLLAIGLVMSSTAAAQAPENAASFDAGALYRQLHAHPELSFEEGETAATLAHWLRDGGFDVTEGIGGHGLVALLRNGPGPTLLMRMDMDALPVREQTGLPYASERVVEGGDGQPVPVMHACGHDVHMSVVTATARRLAAAPDAWSGTLMVIAQPAEERGAGARLMLEDGLYERFAVPDLALSLHTIANLPAGTIGYRAGYAMANVDMVDLTVRGVGGHGSYPHTTRDPIVLASSIVMDLQTLVSRELHPIDPGVVTVGAFHAGTKHNIIPDEARLQLTVRSYSDGVREQLLAGIERIALHDARAFGVPDDRLPVVSVRDEYTPALYNDPELVARSVTVLEALLGEDRVMEVPQEMGGEDFSRYGRTVHAVPSFMFRLGVVPPERFEAAQAGREALVSLHSPFFAPEPDASIDTGIAALEALALDFLGVGR